MKRSEVGGLSWGGGGVAPSATVSGLWRKPGGGAQGRGGWGDTALLLRVIASLNS